jgi:hypothetical protein
MSTSRRGAESTGHRELSGVHSERICFGIDGDSPENSQPTQLALQLHFTKVSESMGNHDSKIVDAGSVD